MSAKFWGHDDFIFVDGEPMDDTKNLPLRARMDLLKQMTLEMLVAQFSAKHFVDATLSDLEQISDEAYLRDLGVGY
jgi:hypothetical protein